MSAASLDALNSRFAEALALHERGRLEDAERLYLAILSADDSSAPARLQLAALRLQQSRFAEALQLSEAALRHAPDSAEAHASIGTALHLLGRDEEAASAYEAALTLAPDSAEAYYGLGLTLHALKRYDEAIACHERALVIDPDYAEASCALGAAFNALKRYPRAADCFRRALDVDPEYPEALCGLAETAAAQGRDNEAIGLYEKAAALRPEHAPTLNALGNALRSVGRHREAIDRFRQAIAIEPDRGDRHLQLAVALEELGDIAEARRAFERAFELGPDNPQCIFGIVNARRVKGGDPALAALSAWEPRVDETGAEPVLFHFAKSKALSDLGRDDEAFAHLLIGNRLKRERLTYDEARILDLLRRMANVFTQEFIEQYRGAGYPSARPILIVGMPRSGSTLVEQILASHAAVFGGGERPDFRAALRDAGIDPEAPDFPESCGRLDRSQLARVGAAYTARLSAAATAAGSGDALRITDKMLANFWFAGLLQIATPNARIIHTRRDPIDNFMSCFSKLFATDIPYAYDLEEFGRYYHAYDALMAHWCRVLPPGVMLDVQYEELVADFENQTRRIIAHCGLEWDDACLSFYKTERPVQTASVVQVRQPIYHTSVGRWRPGDELLRPLLRALAGG